MGSFPLSTVLRITDEEWESNDQFEGNALRYRVSGTYAPQIPAYSRKILRFLHPIRTLIWEEKNG